MTTLDVPSQKAVSVFDDADPVAYWDPAPVGRRAVENGFGVGRRGTGGG
jgi:hypothetical protein